MADNLDARVQPNEGSIQDTNKDLVYARKYWENPNRSFDDFAHIMTGVMDGAKNGMLSLTVNPVTEEGKELISAHRRLALAIGIDIKQFTFDSKTSSSHALVYEGDTNIPEMAQAKRDREYAIKLLVDDKDRRAFFKAMKTTLENSLSQGKNQFFQLIGEDNPGTIAEDSKARLSARRLLYRAFGYRAGEWDVRSKSGTAILTIEK